MAAIERSWIPPSSLDMTCLGICLVAFPHHERLPGWFWLLLVVSVLIARAVVAGRASAPRRWLIAPPIIATAGALFHDFDSLLNPDGGTAFLLVALCGKLLESRTLREARVLQLLIFFASPLGLLFDTSIGAALMAVSGMFVALAAMVMTQPATGGVRAGVALRASLVALCQALPVMIVLFVFFPRLAPLWNLPKPGDEPAVGFSDDMDLSGLGSLNDNPAIAFRVKFPGQQPSSSDLYWRMVVLDSLEGERWFWRKGNVLQVPQGAPEADLVYTVYPEPGVLGYVPHLDPVGALPDRPLRQFEGAVIVMPDSQSRDPWTLLRRTSPGTASGPPGVHTGEATVPRHATSLPERLAPRSRELAREWKADGAQTPEQMVQRFADWTVAQGFSYTLDPGMSNGDPTDGFMFESREGYCSHYANALVVMLRETGTPARLVTGFQGGEFNSDGDYWIVRQSDAHAWMEYLGDNGRWHRVDPTTFVAPERVRLGSRVHQRGVDLFGLEFSNPRHWSVFSRLGKAVDYLNYQWITKVVAYDGARQEGLLDRLPDVAGLSGRVAYLLGAIALSGALVVILVMKPWTSARRPPEVRMLDRLLSAAKASFRPRRTGETALAYATALTASSPEAGAALLAFLQEFNRQVYGPPRDARNTDNASQTGEPPADRIKVLYRNCLRSLRISGLRGSRAR
jgi:transglutaminase-like putative cysteine protease